MDNGKNEMVVDKAQSNIGFRLMIIVFTLRDFFRPRMRILKEVGIKPGFCVLDYGCGPGSYTVATSELVGKLGKVYSLDIHPLAVQRIKKIASKKGLVNVETIQSDCMTGLPNSSVDVVLLYDIFHTLSAPQEILKELHRVLKPEGLLSFNDHHMKGIAILSSVTGTGLFLLSKKKEKTYSFTKRSRPDMHNQCDN